jgi:cytidylate kinase
MNVITVTREFGAGGYEVAGRLAEALGWELLDRALLHQAAAVENLPDEELERLDEKVVSLGDRFRLHSPHQQYLHGLREAALQAAARGNVVLVGRGTGHLLADRPKVLHLRLVAPKEWRAGRMSAKEGWTREQALERCTEQDRTRERFTRYLYGEGPPSSRMVSPSLAIENEDSRADAIMPVARSFAPDSNGFPSEIVPRYPGTELARVVRHSDAHSGLPQALQRPDQL